VAEDFLNVAEVGFVLQEMRGASVPPDVASNALLDAGQLGAFGDDAVERGAAQGPRLAGEEQRIRKLPVRLAPASCELRARTSIDLSLGFPDRMISATLDQENDVPRSHIRSPDGKAHRILFLRALRALRGDPFFFRTSSPLTAR